MRIWITASRQIRTLCEKHDWRPFELKHIGSFFKPKGESYYCFVPNEDFISDGKLHLSDINNENQKRLPSEVRNSWGSTITNI
jgi:hypothetical protein